MHFLYRMIKDLNPHHPRYQPNRYVHRQIYRYAHSQCHSALPTCKDIHPYYSPPSSEGCFKGRSMPCVNLLPCTAYHKDCSYFIFFIFPFVENYFRDLLEIMCIRCYTHRCKVWHQNTTRRRGDFGSQAEP